MFIVDAKFFLQKNFFFLIVERSFIVMFHICI
jgi:hypothetical protein